MPLQPAERIAVLCAHDQGHGRIALAVLVLPGADLMQRTFLPGNGAYREEGRLLLAAAAATAVSTRCYALGASRALIPSRGRANSRRR